jgi:ubiquinone/menaquinone biosynthesis C-methylase UbiE
LPQLNFKFGRIFNVGTLENHLNSISRGAFLDVATGQGGFLEWALDQIAQPSEVAAVDFQRQGMTQRDNFFKSRKIDRAQMDSASLGFPTAHFNLVTMANSLHHLSQPQITLDEIFRVLQPGGNFILVEMYRDHQRETQMTHVLLHDWWAQIDTLLGVPHFPTHTRQEIIDMLGDRVVKIESITDESDTDEDCFDAERMEFLQQRFEISLDRVRSHPQFGAIKKQAEELKSRLQKTGFVGATQLQIIATKS